MNYPDTSLEICENFAFHRDRVPTWPAGRNIFVAPDKMSGKMMEGLKTWQGVAHLPGIGQKHNQK